MHTEKITPDENLQISTEMIISYWSNKVFRRSEEILFCLLFPKDWRSQKMEDSHSEVQIYCYIYVVDGELSNLHYTLR